MTIVLKEFLSPINLSKALVFYISKMRQVIIIYKNENLILTVF